MMSAGFLEANGFPASYAAFSLFSKRPPCQELVPLFEMVAMSAMPPYSAALFSSLTLISAIVLKEGNNSLIGALPLTAMVLMPSRLTDNELGFDPATDMLPTE